MAKSFAKCVYKHICYASDFVKFMKLLENIEKRVEKWLISLGGLRVIFAIFICLYIFFAVLIIFII